MYHILDTDLYKFSTSYAYFKLYPNAEGMFEFTDRNKECWKNDNGEQETFFKYFDYYLEEASKLYLDNESMLWCIDNIPYIPQTYWEWLTTFRFDNNKVV